MSDDPNRRPGDEIDLADLPGASTEPDLSIAGDPFAVLQPTAPPTAPEPVARPLAAPPVQVRVEPEYEPEPAPVPMAQRPGPARPDWQTKPTDRFVLKFIKENVSAHITPGLAATPAITPLMITVASAVLGITAGVLFGLGWAWIGALVAAAGQILDGVDGQLARYTGRESKAGAFWDSVLDRYADGALMVGLVVYLARLPDFPVPVGLIVLLGAMALIGCNLVSYSTARAASLGLYIGPPTLVSKGARTTLIVLCGLLSLAHAQLPLLALVALALIPNAVVVLRLAEGDKGADG